jgi:hypothetical protein
MNDLTLFGLSNAGMVVSACLIGLWTVIQVLMNLVQPEKD